MSDPSYPAGVDERGVREGDEPVGLGQEGHVVAVVAAHWLRAGSALVLLQGGGGGTVDDGTGNERQDGRSLN